MGAVLSDCSGIMACRGLLQTVSEHSSGIFLGVSLWNMPDYIHTSVHGVYIHSRSIAAKIVLFGQTFHEHMALTWVLPTLYLCRKAFCCGCYPANLCFTGTVDCGGKVEETGEVRQINGTFVEVRNNITRSMTEVMGLF